MPTGVFTYFNILVRVLNVYTSPLGQRATIEALTGEPFLAWTHGGWCYSRTTRVSVALLRSSSPQE
ncbi:MAG: hypothetical protein HUU38_24815 [Anaerolineales bacterium]|nr:hypothetical protein [Anaerolineales bacterium]